MAPPLRLLPRFPRCGTPESFGWLRTPALDRGADRAWETPDDETVWLAADVRRLVQIGPKSAPHPETERARR